MSSNERRRFRRENSSHFRSLSLLFFSSFDNRAMLLWRRDWTNKAGIRVQIKWKVRNSQLFVIGSFHIDNIVENVKTWLILSSGRRPCSTHSKVSSNFHTNILLLSLYHFFFAYQLVLQRPVDDIIELHTCRHSFTWSSLCDCRKTFIKFTYATLFTHLWRFFGSPQPCWVECKEKILSKIQKILRIWAEFYPCEEFCQQQGTIDCVQLGWRHIVALFTLELIINSLSISVQFERNYDNFPTNFRLCLHKLFQY